MRYISPFGGFLDRIDSRKLFVSVMFDFSFDVSGWVHFVRNSDMCSVTELTDETIGH